MVLLALGAAGYAAYVAQEKLLEDGPNDPKLDVTNKAFIQLLKHEQELSALEYPISTITFFKGNYQQVAPILEKRSNRILQHNPWLTGCLAWKVNGDDANKDKGINPNVTENPTDKPNDSWESMQTQTAKPTRSMCIYYDENRDTLPSCTSTGCFQVLEPFVVPIHRSTPYQDILKNVQCMKVVLPPNYELIGKHDQPPFWKVTLIPDAETPGERFSLVVSMSHAVGDAHTFYKLYHMLNVTHCPLDDTTTVPTDSLQVPILPLDPDRCQDYPKALVQRVGSLREATYMQAAISKPPINLIEIRKETKVRKLFTINETFVRLLQTQQSNPDQLGTEDGPLFGQEVTQSGRILIDPPLSDAPATANETSKQVSTNSAITSWFFCTNEASIGLMLVNMRNRMHKPGSESVLAVPLGDCHAGNYVHPIIYTPMDYETPHLIQESLHHLKRCHPETPTELPRFRWDMTSSISVNWSSFYPPGTNVDEASGQDPRSLVEAELHLPLWGFPMDMFPNRVSLLHLFTAYPGRTTVNKRARVGAFVMCSEAAWKNIRASGIVDEVISDL